MDSFTKTDLMNLIEAECEWCVSLYLPMVRAGTEVQQNPIRLKNLLRKAEDQLIQLGVRKADAADLLAPASAMLEDPGTWRQPGDGMAVFIQPDGLLDYQLPLSFNELVVVKTRFHVKPLLPLLSGDGRFYVLALSQDQIRLLEGTRDSVNEIDLEGVPDSLADVLSPEAMQREQASLRKVTQGSTATYQGYGGSSDTDEKRLGRYFRRVDSGLRDLLGKQHIPLVLAGVEYLLPIYHDASEYSYLLEDGITGNPQTLSAKELHRRAWEIVKPHFVQEQAQQIEQFQTLAGRDDPRAVTSLKQTILAAHRGQVATLFVALGKQIWGRFDPEQISMHVHPEMQAGDQDLLDLLAAQTVANSGTVYALPEDEVPGGGDFAAILRY